MKRGKKLIALLAVLLALVCATLAVTMLNPEKKNDTEESVTVFSLDPEKVTKLGWDYSDAASFTRIDGKWSNDADKDFPVKESCLEDMLAVLSRVVATKTIPQTQDLNQYGLEHPYCSISVTVEQNTHHLAIGDQNIYSGQRYFSTGDGNVYLVDNEIVNYFKIGPEGALAMEEIPDLSSLTALKFQCDDQVYEIVYQEGEGNSAWYLDGQALQEEQTANLLTVVENFAWKRCADYKATDFAQYGLDSPSAVVTATYPGGTFVLELGTKTEAGVYARLPDSNMVYLISGSVLTALLEGVEAVV